MNNITPFQKRNLFVMFFLILITGTLYFFYWLYKTKEEINKIGGTIPTFWFAILPFFNFYFDYRYAQDFVKCVKHQENSTGLEVAYFLLIVFLPIIAPLIIQNDLNNYQVNSRL